MSAPKIHPLTSIPHQIAESHYFPNGCALHWLEGGTQEVAKVECIWLHHPIEGIAPWEKDMVQKMQMEGSKSYSRKQISELLDFYGVYSQFEGWMDYSSMVWHGLTKNIPFLIDLMFDIQLNPTFSQEEWSILQKSEIQSFHLSNEKVNNLARRVFNKHLFPDHPFGLTISEDGIKNLSPNRLKFIHEQLFLQPFHVFVSGKNIGELVENIGKKLEKLPMFEKRKQGFHVLKYENKSVFQLKENAQQNCLRIGRLAMGRNNEDFTAFQVLNTIIGGYFGSRLMKNLREDKGLTYGIGSMCYPFYQQSMFLINAEVKASESDLALQEIQNEIVQLQNAYISKEELDLVINTMQGQLIQGSDGIFAQMDRNKNIILNQLPSNYYEIFFDSISKINPGKILELSRNYLNWDDLLRVNVGLGS